VRAFSTACSSLSGIKSIGEDEPQHTMPLARTAARDLWRKRHADGNTMKKGSWSEEETTYRDADTNP